jgi:uncharacterized membrane protein YkvA (DUF1232 family)
MSDDVRIVIELNPREQRLYDRLRSHVATARVGGGSDLRDLLLLLPDFTVLLFRLLGDPRVPFAAKTIAVLGLGYLLLPIDLIPEVIFGPIGLIDDLLIVGTALSRLLNQVHPDVVRSHWSGRGDALEAIQRVTEWTERQVMGRIRGTLRWLRGGG